MNRKDEHIKYALKYESTGNSFDDMELIQCSIPKYNLEEIDMSVNFAENTFEYPFFINAMTGGSKKGKEINRKLAKVAKECNILFVTGSYSAALKNPDDDSFEVVRKENKGLLLGTNIGADKNYTAGMKAVEDLKPLFLQIHVKNVKVPLILKEVGFGMSPETVKKGMELGIKTFDISGRGGTSFAYIENMRGENRFSYLNEWGQSTVSCLLGLKDYIDKAEIIASGGVRHPLDIIKALVMGAKAVGLSGTMLRLAENNSTEEIIETVNSWKEECRMIMCALNAKNVKELQNVKYVLYGKTREFCLK